MVSLSTILLVASKEKGKKEAKFLSFMFADTGKNNKSQHVHGVLPQSVSPSRAVYFSKAINKVMKSLLTKTGWFSDKQSLQNPCDAFYVTCISTGSTFNMV